MIGSVEVSFVTVPTLIRRQLVGLVRSDTFIILYKFLYNLLISSAKFLLHDKNLAYFYSYSQNRE